jgi:hypothetical protein
MRYPALELSRFLTDYTKGRIESCKGATEKVGGSAGEVVCDELQIGMIGPTTATEYFKAEVSVEMEHVFPPVFQGILLQC